MDSIFSKVCHQQKLAAELLDLVYPRSTGVPGDKSSDYRY